MIRHIETQTLSESEFSGLKNEHNLIKSDITANSVSFANSQNPDSDNL
jgi:hypothetical protein